MNRKYDLSAFESTESMFEQIERDYIVSENNKTIVLKQLEEYFWLKENGLPSSISAKWTEISKTLESLKPKVDQ
jgi:hypothetical protein